ncbi:hypothetical protein F2Q69_00002899 [Brassica cretica]|uniref:RNase H type-1 domain-containing protein n=1 Tax=Brassica cretica TaxID=69181 RepID=A0A8S9P863_BRACR|nr:hypothetical protein F2Q69_00002899 [Brassica cretica]
MELCRRPFDVLEARVLVVTTSYSGLLFFTETPPELLFFTEKPPELLIFLEPPPELLFFIDLPLHVGACLLHRSTTACRDLSSSPSYHRILELLFFTEKPPHTGASLLHRETTRASLLHRATTRSTPLHRATTVASLLHRDNTRASLLQQATTRASLLHRATTGASLLHRATTGASRLHRAFDGVQSGSFEDIVDAYLAYGVMSRYNSQRTSGQSSGVSTVKERRKWSPKEDLILIGAWLNTNKDPIEALAMDHSLPKPWKCLVDDRTGNLYFWNPETNVAQYERPICPPPRNVAQDSCTIEFDGASRGNPGRAGAGAVLRASDNTVLFYLREGLGFATNNVAEYRALILGLECALSKGFRNVRVQGDSMLVCMQVQGAWRVQDPKMAQLCGQAKELMRQFSSFHIQHVGRELNSEADAQANHAINLAGELINL